MHHYEHSDLLCDMDTSICNLLTQMSVFLILLCCNHLENCEYKIALHLHYHLVEILLFLYVQQDQKHLTPQQLYHRI